MFYVCNVQYPPEMAFTLEFMQRVFFGVNPERGSKAEKKGKKRHFIPPQDMTEATALSAIEKTTVGIYVSRDTPGNYSFDVGIIIEGVVVLKDLDNVAIAVAMLFGLLYSVNTSYPSQLRYTFEVIQKVVMGLDATELSRKAQNFKTKLLM
ncbi:unnamed protein product [Oreochromis niloticus]|nr:unnamed protein product [Mustela putorius furo]